MPFIHIPIASEMTGSIHWLAVIKNDIQCLYQMQHTSNSTGAAIAINLEQKLQTKPNIHHHPQSPYKLTAPMMCTNKR